MLAAISPEALRVQGPERTNADVGEAWAEAHRMLRAALARPEIERLIVMVGIPGAGKSTWLKYQPHDPGVIAFDAVFADRNRRIAMARRGHEAGKAAWCVWLTTDLATCIERNDRRPAWRRVPEPFLRRCEAQLRLAPPTTLEGWDRVLTLCPQPLAAII